MSAYKLGAVEGGYTLRRKRGTVELWETPGGGYIIYLYVTAEHVLWAMRKNREDADAFFDSICNLLPDLGPEESSRRGVSPLHLIPPLSEGRKQRGRIKK
jgi:hypothetical protein